jgi:carboxypeptidase family protein
MVWEGCMSSMTGQVSTRLITGVCFALLASACGGGRSPVPSAPTPAAVEPTPNVVTYTITGVVADESGRPIAGAGVDACCVGGVPITYSRLHAGDALTDESGHFRMVGLPAGTHLVFRLGKDGYVPQCAPAPVTVQGDLAVDFTLVSRANLTASAQSAPGFRSISGTVVEITATGREPVSGAFVDYSAYEDFEPAGTYTDQFGRFALCGLPTEDDVALGAFMPGLNGNASVPPGQTTGVEIVLRPY